MYMKNSDVELKLRNAALERLLAASLQDVVSSREAALEQWRLIKINNVSVHRSGSES